MKVCVLGHSGLLGSAFRAILKNSKEFKDVLSADTPRRIVNFEISTEEVINKIIAYNPDLIINCISNIDIEYCERNYDLSLSVEKKIVLDSLAASQVSNCLYVYISSDYVFSGEKENYITSSAKDPINCYGKIKSICEDIVLKNNNTYVMRPSIIYGKNFYTQTYSAFINDVLGHERPNNVLSIKYPIWSIDLANAILKTVSSSHAPGCYHFTSSEGKTRGDWFDELIEFPRIISNLSATQKSTSTLAAKPNDVLLLSNHRYGHIRNITNVMRENNGNFEIR